MDEIKAKVEVVRNAIKKDLPPEDLILANALVDLALIFLLDLHRLATK